MITKVDKSHSLVKAMAFVDIKFILILSECPLAVLEDLNLFAVARGSNDRHIGSTDHKVLVND